MPLSELSRAAGMLLAAAALVAAAPPAPAPPAPPAATASLDAGSVAEAVERLKPGEYLWEPEIAPEGPLTLIVSTRRQRAILYRNGVPIAITTVSTGRPGHRTPTGIFTVLQKQVEHYSSLYDDAPMPYMQRLTWGGVALHGGNLPGYPASHGCIRLPLAFARLLYGVTRLGMTVIVTDAAAVPRLAPTASPLDPRPGSASPAAPAAPLWRPERAPSGPVSIVVSAADRVAVVLRNGVEIGRAPVTVDGPVTGTSAYFFAATGPEGPRWSMVPLGGAAAAQPLPPGFWHRFGIDPAFRAAVATIVAPGTTVVLTADSLVAGSAGRAVTVIDAEPPRR